MSRAAPQGRGTVARAMVALAALAAGAPVMAAPVMAAPVAAAGEGPAAPSRVVKGSVAIEFSIARLGPGGDDRPLQEGDHAEVRFRLTDAASGAPLAGAKPAAWLDLGQVIQGQGGEQRECKDKVGLYLKGIVGIRPMVDLNSSYLLVLGQDPSIAVIDPVVSMTGRTSLYATVVLKRPGADWVRSADTRRLYVSMPQAGEVAVVDAEAFKVEATVEVGPNPVRVALQPDGRRLWVASDGQGRESGVTVVDTQTLRKVASIPTGRGHHELAFSADGRHAFVSNRDAGTVTVVEAATLRKVRDLATGPLPISLAVSPLSQALYVADAKAGTISAYGAADLRRLAQIQARPGLGPLRVSQDGRWAVAVNPAEQAVFVVDTTRNALVHVIPVGGQPYQVTFTAGYAYLRLIDSGQVVMVNLASLGPDRAPVVQRFEAGAGAPRQAGELSIADAIAQASLEAAVYLVNPADNTVYFYMEGMNAPMGSYGAYGHAARAVAVVDRSLKEQAPGYWTGRLRLPAAGRYDVAFLLDAPRTLHCFSAEVQPSPGLRQDLGALAVDFLDTPARWQAGAPLAVRFRLADPATHAPRAGLGDVALQYWLAPGQLRGEAPALEVSPGVYQAAAAPSRAGAWYFHVVVPSLSVKSSDLPFHSVVVEAPARPARPAPPAPPPATPPPATP